MRRRIEILTACMILQSTVATAADRTATAYQVSPAHNARVNFGVGWGPTLQTMWTAKLDGPASYPLVVHGMVFALVQGSPDEIVALDASSGAMIWKLSAGSNQIVGLAFDQARIFAVDSAGTLSAFDAVKGKLAWSEPLPGQYAFSAAPSALNGVVYVGGAGEGGTLYAVRETDGHMLWTQSVENGDDSSPAVTSTGVYVAYPCQYYDFAPLTGKLIWHYSGDCEGGGGETAVVADGLAFIRDFPIGPNTIFNAQTGQSVGSFAASAPPAIATANRGFFLDNGTLSGIDPKTSQLLWEFTGDGSIALPPLIVGHWVVDVSAKGTLYVIDATSGSVGFSTRLSGTIGAALGAGDGLVLVPTGNALTALQSAP